MCYYYYYNNIETVFVFLPVWSSNEWETSTFVDWQSDTAVEEGKNKKNKQQQNKKNNPPPRPQIHQ